MEKFSNEEKNKKIEPRKAENPQQRAILFWQWAFEEIKKGKLTKNALNNVSMKIGHQEVIDVHHTESDNDEEDISIAMLTKDIQRTNTLNSSEATP